MAIIAEEKKTVQDYLRLEEGAPYQLLKGKLIMSPAPNRKHQQLILQLSALLFNYVKGRQAGEVYIAPFDVYLDDDNVVQPDISFFAG